METVASTFDFEVFHQPGGAHETWVTFAGMGGREPTFASLIATRGAKAFHVISVSNDWYQNPSLGLTLMRLPLSGRVIVFGASMGGFGALAWAHVLKPSAVIVASPQTLVGDAATRGADDRYRPNWEALEAEGRLRQPDAGMYPISAPVHVLYDPASSEDRWHAERLKWPVLYRMHVRFLGHDYLSDLNRMGRCGRLINILLNNEPGASMLIRELRRGRGERYHYRLNLGRLFLKRRRLHTAMRYLEWAIELDPRRCDAHWEMSVALEALGRMDEARQAAERCIQADGDMEVRWSVFHRLAHLYAVEGRYGEAEDTFRRGLQVHPKCAGLHAELGRFLLDIPKGDCVVARDHLAEACRLSPADARYRALLASVSGPTTINCDP